MTFSYSDTANPSGESTLEKSFSKEWEIAAKNQWRFCVKFHGYGPMGSPYTLDAC